MDNKEKNIVVKRADIYICIARSKIKSYIKMIIAVSFILICFWFFPREGTKDIEIIFTAVVIGLIFVFSIVSSKREICEWQQLVKDTEKDVKV